MSHTGNMEWEVSFVTEHKNQSSSTGKSNEGLESQKKVKFEGTSFHHLLGWRFYKLPGIPVSVLNHDHCENPFPYI